MHIGAGPIGIRNLVQNLPVPDALFRPIAISSREPRFSFQFPQMRGISPKKRLTKSQTCWVGSFCGNAAHVWHTWPLLGLVLWGESRTGD